MQRSWLFGVFMVVVSQAMSQPTIEPTDLRAYLDSIRKSGMSEDAKRDISSVASFTTGAIVTRFQKDESTGQYWPTYQSTVCPIPSPGQSALAKWKDDVREKTDSETQQLKALADSDSSSFVSTEEGAQFRSLVEFAIALSQVSDHERNDVVSICKGLRMTKEQLNERKSEYRNLTRRANTLGIETLPKIN